MLADKLTAFAPHTSGMRLNQKKELNIIKQLFDISVLTEHLDDLEEVRSVFHRVAKTELSYRDLSLSPNDVLWDVIRSAACIASRGVINSDEYILYKLGINGIGNHLVQGVFNGETAVRHACITMFAAAAVMTDQNRVPELKPENEYVSASIPCVNFRNSVTYASTGKAGVHTDI